MNHTRRQRPNVLLICTDHWPGLVCSPAHHPVVLTPTIAQLAQCGVWYTNAYSTCPSCIPARRSLMTGMTARSHGDRNFNQTLPMPDAATLARCFRDNGYATHAVGKLHVYPQRDKIGFDEVQLFEEGRSQFGMGADEWEQALIDAGFPGMEYAGGGSQNDYNVVPWHLPEHLHPINWTAREMCRAICHRDQTRPAFWYLSFAAPHPPLVPLESYLNLYRDITIDPPLIGDWARDSESLPWALRSYQDGGDSMTLLPSHAIELARRAFYATLTHLDHQVRVVIGTLREQGLIDDTIIAFTSDHGDMLGDHGRWAKSVLYEMSAKIPLIVIPAADDGRLVPGTCDSRLVMLEDVMPTLLDLAGLPVPSTVDGASLLGEPVRQTLYAEHWEGARATRMVRDDHFKLIYYPVGNHIQLFDLLEDPRECTNIADHPEHDDGRRRLTETLIGNLYGDDLAWVNDGKLIGLPDRPTVNAPNRGLSGQRGLRFT